MQEIHTYSHADIHQMSEEFSTYQLDGSRRTEIEKCNSDVSKIFLYMSHYLTTPQRAKVENYYVPYMPGDSGYGMRY